MDPHLLTYYEAIERASAEMLAAARAGNWDVVVKLEGACVLLISQLKHAAQQGPADVDADAEIDATADPARALNTDGLALTPGIADRTAADRYTADPGAVQQAARVKSRIMQRILVNDAEIRNLAEPWLQALDDTLQRRRRTLH